MTPIWLLLVILIFANSNPPENPYLWSMAMGGILWGFSFIASSPTLFYKVYLERNKITVKNLLHRREIELEEIEFFNVIELTHYEKIFSNNIQLKLRNNKTCFSFLHVKNGANYPTNAVKYFC